MATDPDADILKIPPGEVLVAIKLLTADLYGSTDFVSGYYTKHVRRSIQINLPEWQKMNDLQRLARLLVLTKSKISLDNHVAIVLPD
jgi:hypothetical protein